ncbi:hypothetical protein CL622_01615 [archaeon]|nr:hypothetical protein [archaeon]
MRKCKTCGKQLEKNEKRFCKTCKEFHQYRYPKRQLKKVLKEYDQWKTPRALGVLARCDGFVLDKLIRDLISLGYVVTYQSLIVSTCRIAQKNLSNSHVCINSTGKVKEYLPC